MIYTLKKGDTLSELAVRFGTTTEALVVANAIRDPDKIYAGKNLVIPNKLGPVSKPWRWDIWTWVNRFFGV